MLFRNSTSSFLIHNYLADGNGHDNPGSDAEVTEACSDNQHDTVSDTPSSIEEDDSDRNIPRVEAHLYTLLVLFPLDLLNVLAFGLPCLSLMVGQ